MKIRNGFISNSSSSSFIILYDNNASIKLKDIEWSVNDLIDYTENVSRGSWSSECTQLKALGVENVIEYIQDRWGYDSGYAIKLVDIINNSRKDSAAVINISYHDVITKKLFNWLKNRKKFIVVEDVEE